MCCHYKIRMYSRTFSLVSTINSVQHGHFSFLRVFQTHDYRSTASWTHSARLSFVENQIQTCIAIQSATEMEHWYSILGVHLAKHGDEKRIRTHLNDLLGTPNILMELDGDEPTTKETILVRTIVFLQQKKG